MTFVLTGLDVRDTEIVLIGGGDVTARRAAALHTQGAILRIIAPELSPRTEAFLRSATASDNTTAANTTSDNSTPHTTTPPVWEPRCYRPEDLDDAWLVHTATGDPAVDSGVAEECRARRIWCINASCAPHGSARMPAQARRRDMVFGALSTGSPNPRRSAEVVRAVARQVDETHQLAARPQTTTQPATPSTGTVHLIGGGPGPTDLLTVRAHRLLAAADVIVHDRLGPTDLAQFCDENTEVIDVGKRPGHHPSPQEEINAIIVDRAQRGLVRVRTRRRGGHRLPCRRGAGRGRPRDQQRGRRAVLRRNPGHPPGCRRCRARGQRPPPMGRPDQGRVTGRCHHRRHPDGCLDLARHGRHRAGRRCPGEPSGGDR